MLLLMPRSSAFAKRVFIDGCQRPPSLSRTNGDAHITCSVIITASDWSKIRWTTLESHRSAKPGGRTSVMTLSLSNPSAAYLRRRQSNIISREPQFSQASQGGKPQGFQDGEQPAHPATRAPHLSASRAVVLAPALPCPVNSRFLIPEGVGARL